MKYLVEVWIKCKREIEVDAENELIAENEAIEIANDEFKESWESMSANIVKQ